MQTVLNERGSQILSYSSYGGMELNFFPLVTGMALVVDCSIEDSESKIPRFPKLSFMKIMWLPS